MKSIIIILIIKIIIFILYVVYYNKTKEESLKYKQKSSNFAVGLTALVSINVLLILNIKDSETTIKVGLILGIFLSFVLSKCQLRASQGLCEQNNYLGSSYLTGNFKFSNIDWKYTMKISISLMIWSAVVFIIYPPQIAKDVIIKENDIYVLVVLNNIISIGFIAPISEEILYRFFGVNLFIRWFGKKRLGIIIAITIPTVIWTYMHSGMLLNDWVKYIQVFPMGIINSYVLFKKDLEHCILIHILFNLSLVISSFLLA
ncbi:CPBP family intramembrane metalloprotease [Clostridiaceae bacterium M8S5]|nr:CPBP family intramembrane metalloprotease [Clostridiaceae bacterium M8S5]